MLRWRLVAAAAMIAPLLGVLWMDDQFNGGRPGIWLGALAVATSLMATRELNQILSSAGLATSSWPNVVAVFCVTAASLGPIAWRVPAAAQLSNLVWTFGGLVAAVGVIFLAELIRYRDPGESLQRLGGGALATIYLGLLFACLIQLRLLDPSRLGLLAIIATIWVVKLSDAGAYFVGKKFGRTKLCRVSPKKTVEGLLGGLAFALLGAWLARTWLIPTFSPNHPVGSAGAYLLFGICLTLAGLVGDLAESLLKRDVGQKDSSNWLPGLGGILDVVDSLLAVAPISLLWWASGQL